MTSPIYGWPLPQFATAPPDGPAAFQALANAIEATYDAPAASYTPTLVADGSVQPSGLTGVQGYWSQRGGWVSVAVFMTFGPSINGGWGALNVGLPMVAATIEQYIPCKLWVPGVGDFVGQAWVTPGGQAARPQFPRTTASSIAADWRNLDTTGTAGTGTPAAAGSTLLSTGNFAMTGRYAVA